MSKKKLSPILTELGYILDKKVRELRRDKTYDNSRIRILYNRPTLKKLNESRIFIKMTNHRPYLVE